MPENLNARINELMRRMRSLEDRLFSVEERQEQFRSDFSEKILQNKDMSEDAIKALAGLKKENDTLKDEVKRMRKEMTKFASKAKLTELEAYINILDPMNIVTKSEVKKMIKKKVE